MCALRFSGSGVVALQFDGVKMVPGRTFSVMSTQPSMPPTDVSSMTRSPCASPSPCAVSGCRQMKRPFENCATALEKLVSVCCQCHSCLPCVRTSGKSSERSLPSGLPLG